jgi:hypothetical protein
MSRRGGPARRPSRRSFVEPIAAAAALAAVFAPATLTGSTPVDMVQRGVIAGGVTFIGAHGRRRTWLLAGGLLAIPATGVSLILVLIGLGATFGSTLQARRSRRIGAISVACFTNAIFWYPSHDAPWGHVVALIGCTMLVVSGYPNIGRRRKRTASATIAALAVAVVVATALAGVAMLLAASSVRSGSTAAQDALASARGGDGPTAATQLAAASDDFEQAAARLDGPLTLGARLLPGVAQQIDAVRTTVEQGERITEIGDDLVATADYDSLKYDGRLDLDQLAALEMPTERADLALSTAQRELDRVQEARLLPPLRSGIEEFSEQIADARSDTQVARSLVRVAPGLFGAGGERRYLVIFLTPAELRGAGGFIGSYAELRALDGEVDLVRSGRIDDLIEAAAPGTRTLSGPQDYLDRYGAFRPADFPQDATFSPHFPSSASVIAELYPQSGGVPVDGVIGVDPTGLAALLELTGPVAVPGLVEPLRADDAADLLTRRQYLELGTRAERGEVLAEATRATFEQLVTSALPSPRALADVLSPAARGGHLRLWSPLAGEQEVFEELGAEGNLAIPEGADGFSVTQRNVGNNKIDAYLRRTIDYAATVDARTGELDATMRIELTNDVPAGLALPPAVVENTRAAPTGTNVTVVTVHTRHRVTAATIDGTELILGPGTERGLFAWDTPTLEIPPGATVVLELELAGAIDLRDGYDLRILPQPVANPDLASATLEVIGGTVEATGEREVQVLEPGPLTVLVDRRVPLTR